MAVYVMSDIHGWKERFDEMLEKIAFTAQDELYILGDVIDRGPDGIALLMEIKEHENMHLLMGNHEHMMLEYFEAMEEGKQNAFIFSGGERIRRWNRNHNEPTLHAYQALSPSAQKELLAYIKNLPLLYADVEVADHHYYLVHAAPTPRITTGSITLKECEDAGINPYDILWERMDPMAELPNARTIIFGHTPTLFFQDKKPYEIWTGQKNIQETDRICIDCGCAANNEYSQLGCIRLDDLEVFYA